MYFWHVLPKVNCRISRASGTSRLYPHQGSALDPLRTSKCPRPPAAGNNGCWSWHSYLMWFTSNILRGKHISFDRKTEGEMDGNHPNSGNDVENSVQTPKSHMIWNQSFWPTSRKPLINDHMGLVDFFQCYPFYHRRRYGKNHTFKCRIDSEAPSSKWFVVF